MSDLFSERSKRMLPSAIRRMTKLAAGAGPELISFAGGMPNPATFPLKQLSEIASAEICAHQGKNLQYGLTKGHRGLIQWIADSMRKKAVSAGPEDIICTSGSQQALDLIAEIFLEPGDAVFVETPTYIGALAVFRNSGAHMVPIRQDSLGMVPEDLREKLRACPEKKRKFVYVVSNFQNPSGISICAERRKIISELLDEFSVYLIEDDPYGEIYFGEANRPPAPIKMHNPQRVLYLSTFSKILTPTFRTGWVVAAPEIIQKLELAKEAADLCGSALDQKIVYRFCTSPDFEQHLANLRMFYHERYQAMEKALSSSMPSEISWTHPTGGFFIWITLPEKQDAEALLEESISRSKVSYVIGRPFTCDYSGGNYLRLAFSTEDPVRIQEGIARLSKLMSHS